MAAAGYMGSAYNPLIVRGDPSSSDFKVEDVTLPAAIGAERAGRRRTMLQKLDAWQAATEQAQGSARRPRPVLSAGLST